LPSPPFHPIPNTLNLRTATHTLTSNHPPNTLLRPKILFRSGALTHANWHTLHASLGITHIFDLRSQPEIDKAGEPSCEKSAAGITRVWTPVFAATDYSPERVAGRYGMYLSEGNGDGGFVSAYRDILDNAGPAFGRILGHVASLAKDPSTTTETEPAGILVHCTAGKDRTGIFYALLFDFLDVPRQQIAREYHLSEQGLAPFREPGIERVRALPAFSEYVRRREEEEGGREMDEAEQRRAAERMLGAREESLMASLEMVDRVFGGAEAYFRGVCGVPREVLEGVRRVLV
ncbi:hypothetical protein BDW02DRAFT_480813, partial [Decorospora gaudefroyi]